MKIIHCADLHLDSKMESNLDREAASMRRDELLDTFDLGDESGVGSEPVEYCGIAWSGVGLPGK